MIPKLNVPLFGISWPLRQITFWTAAHVFRVAHPLVYMGSGSGDKTFNWVQVFCLLVISAVGTAVWSVLDRRRQNYITMHKWFRLFLRFALAGQMIQYGLIKVIPMQMALPAIRLVEPLGNFSPMGVLWSSVGASKPYEIFTGGAETLGGLLLIFPATATLGALVCLADTVQVFTLNMAYDVPVKLLSLHLIVFSLFLLAAEGRRLMTFFFSGRAIGPSTQRALFKSRRAHRVALALQVLFGLYLAGIQIYYGIQDWYSFGGGRPKPLLYGIWNVEEMSMDGQVRSPLLTDYDRWRRVISDYDTFTTFQRMDETFATFGSSINNQDKTLTLTKSADKSWKSILAFQRPAQDQLILDGTMDGHKVHMQLKLLDRNKLTLVSRGFHWISEYPFQR